MKGVVSILFCLGVAAASAAAPSLTQEQQQELQARLENQRQRMGTVDHVVDRERREIETWYANRLSSLKERLEKLAEDRARRLPLPYRMLWTEFVNTNNHVSWTNPYLSTTAQTFWWDPDLFDLRSAMMDSYFLTALQDLLTDEGFYKFLANTRQSSARDPLLRQEAGRLLRLMTEFKLESERLEKLRDAKFAQVKQWRENRRAEVYRTMLAIKNQVETAASGVVQAIGHSPNGAFCMIDGVDKVLRAGDTIDNDAVQGVRIVKIQQGAIMLEKDGQSWVQKVGEAANVAWTN